MSASSLPVKITTTIPNLYLRSPQPTQRDAEGLSKIFSHKHNNRFEPERPGRAEPTAALYATRIPTWTVMAENGQNCFCLVALASEDNSGEEEIIGFGGFNAFSTRPAALGEGEVKVANIGVMLHEPYTGKGYGLACLRATIQASFDVFGANVVEAETLAVNKPFRGLMRKLELDQFSKLRSENGLEDVLYSFSRTNWDSINSKKVSQSEA